MTFRLSKLHGLGNDFLVLLTDDPHLADDHVAWAGRAVAWCDRHRGIGADGLILGVRGPAAEAAGADLVMHLYNADGSRAEISGNGIRCLAHAEARRRSSLQVDLAIATDGGLRTLQVRPDPADPAAVVASVDMGAATPGPDPDGAGAASPLVAHRTATFDIGNPHLVLLVDDPRGVDMAELGPALEAGYRDGINVHVLAATPGEPDAVTVQHWERGVGITEACGSGASVSALVAHQWGLAGHQVTVHMPGGDAQVAIGDTLVLRGPSVFIADIELCS